MQKKAISMGRPKTEKTRKVMLTLPEEIAMYMEYFVKVAGLARSNSDLVIQLINTFVDTKRPTLNDKDTWKDFIKRLDEMKTDKLDEIFGNSSNDDEEEDEIDDE
jgi:hypothetical protein